MKYYNDIITGTKEERGITSWTHQVGEYVAEDGNTSSCYDLPFGMKTLRKWKWTRYIPVSPTFITGFKCCKCRKNGADITKV